MTVGIVACGALASDIRHVVAAHGWDAEVVVVSALDHLRPERIATDVGRVLDARGDRWEHAVVAFADCGTAGALDAELADRGVPRLAGVDCYDVYAGEVVRDLMAEEPGTFLLTDFLVRGWQGAVVRPLGLDRYPELAGDYFRHYTRVVWLAQRADPTLGVAAADIARSLALPLEVRVTGTAGLEERLATLVAGVEAPAGRRGTDAQLQGNDDRLVGWSSPAA